MNRARLSLLLFGFSILFFQSCVKDDGFSSVLHDVHYALAVTDSNGDVRTSFKPGEELIMVLEEVNTNSRRTANFTYSGLPCDIPSLGFTIEHDDGTTQSFVPDTLFCTLDLKIHELKPFEKRKFERKWSDPIVNGHGNSKVLAPLSPGNYKLNTSFFIHDFAERNKNARPFGKHIVLEYAFEVE